MGMLSVIKNAPAVFTKTAGKLAFKLSKNKPQLMVYSGIVIATGAFVLAIANATKLKEKMFAIESKTDDIQLKKAEAENPENELSDEEKNTIIIACNKDLRKNRVDAAWMIFKMLGVPCILFAGGMSLSLGGHMLLVRRFGELSTAFATLQQSYERYRQLNIAEHGEECDKRYMYGVVGDTTMTTTVTDRNGKEKEVKCKVPIVDPNKSASMYTFCFSEDFSTRCPKDPVNTISFLQSQEKYWNTWMETKHRPVTLYMVLEELGIELDPDDPRNDYIMIAGWRPNGDGDNYIDFGIMRAVNQPALRMEENVVYLNFNCDGNLWHSPRYTKDGRKVC